MEKSFREFKGKDRFLLPTLWPFQLFCSKSELIDLFLRICRWRGRCVAAKRGSQWSVLPWGSVCSTSPSQLYFCEENSTFLLRQTSSSSGFYLASIVGMRFLTDAQLNCWFSLHTFALWLITSPLSSYFDVICVKLSFFSL